MKYWSVIINLIWSSSFAQNIVKDGSFEDMIRCPQNIVQDVKKFPLKHWSTPTLGTTDYANVCSKKNHLTSVPKNMFGVQEAKTGNGYTVLGYKKDYGEYLQAKLSKDLVSNQVYYVEFWVSLSDYSLYKVRGFGAYFSSNEIKVKNEKVLSFQPQISSEEIISDKDNWVKVSGTFIANGTEKYIVIGCFTQINEELALSKTGRKEHPKQKAAYYYIDDVIVRKVKPIAIKQFTSELNKPIILKNITFEFGKSILKETSYVELGRLVEELKTNPSYDISLSGHTDNIGQEEDNLFLSEARAKAVAEYLVNKGIEKERITYKGYGAKNPIVSNETEEGREQNRRVEFILTEHEK